MILAGSRTFQNHKCLFLSCIHPCLRTEKKKRTLRARKTIISKKHLLFKCPHQRQIILGTCSGITFFPLKVISMTNHRRRKHSNRANHIAEQLYARKDACEQVTMWLASTSDWSGERGTRFFIPVINCSNEKYLK